ncbi:response regulator [Paenibacillus thermoaerophilus]|uniref:Response regulator n=1 Tax=Paenibacillus thermoaerophilus TaxID=1215385 RepID=A0ABW2V337_9BACL|nr:response regulator [Paenibacillus thermoaerophilus]TMV17444.1 response regulator [Paenibacillus thermoaerophilus]
MNLLIVEDEARLRQSLAANIPWEDNGIEVVGLAANGIEALRLFERKKPDIVLLDVQMPEMDGLTLARKLREKDAYIKTIILSGHDNFAYAQHAMESGVSKYLLKPAGERDILQAVLAAADQLRQELDRLQNEEQMRQRWLDHLPHLRSAFLEQLLRGAYSPEEAAAIASDYMMELGGEGWQYAVAVVDAEPAVPDDGAEEAAPAPGDLSRARFAAHMLASSIFAQEGCWLCKDAGGFTAILFRIPPGDDPNDGLLRAHAAVSKLLSLARESLKLTLSAGISGSTGGLGELNRLYVQACQALQDRIVYGPGIAIPYREPAERPGSRPLAVSQGEEKALEIALETGDAERASDALSAIWDGIFSEAGSADEVHEGVLYVGSLLVRIVQKQGWTVKEVMKDDYEYFHNAGLLTSKEQIRAWLSRSVAAIVAYQQDRRRTSSHQVVRAILSIIEQEIDQDLTLHTVADRLYVNSSYLSRLFKQETGKSFSAYVQEQKMERAKAALAEGAKVYDAARLVGYRDVSYFTKVFRKYWGVTPGEIKSSR